MKNKFTKFYKSINKNADKFIAVLLSFFMLINFISPVKVRAEGTEETPKPITIESLSTELFYGAEKQSDGTYQWNVPTNDNGYQSGHHFSFRINFSTSGEGNMTPGYLKLKVPATLIKNRSGNNSDTVEWSIPSKQDVQNATDENGKINPEEIDDDIHFAYYLDGSNYIIYNFREISAATNGSIELAYATSENAFAYKDMETQTPFTCDMELENGEKKSADPINFKINTTAQINSTYKRYPYSGKIKTWSDSWGTAVKPANPSDYYYIVWNIESNISATQPYDFKIDDSMNSNLGGMIVLGYKFAGENSFKKENYVSNQTITNTRYDSVLTAIPLNIYADATKWEAVNKETATVTPIDKVDKPTQKTSSQTWDWTKPVFKEPTGHFNGYKYGDGSYRSNYYSYSGGLDFKAGKYSRYDLEQFNGYNDEKKSLTEYNNFDFLSEITGYPLPWTKDTSVSTYDKADKSTAYCNKPVMYELIDDDLYLLNSEKAIKSSNGSSNRTIDNGGIDKDKAIKLKNGDYKIEKLQYSVSLSDASWDSEETGNWQTKSASLTDNDVLVFYGKFNGSNDWVQFATYNIRTGVASPNSTYVKSMNNREIVFADNQNLTGYKITTANAHYSTTIYTVPYVTLLNSTSVMNLIAPKSGDDSAGREIAILNNNTANFYQLNDGITYQGIDYQNLMSNASNWSKILEADHSDTDYAIASYKESSLRKNVISTSNNVKKKYYTITWKIDQSETMVSGENGDESYVPQDSGIFYDLLPEGSVLSKNTVEVTRNGSIIPESSYTVKTISNYQNTGRTMLIVKINQSADKYEVTYDTTHAWNSIKDYGTDVYNPVAYETGNDKITNGYADDGGKLKQASLMSNLVQTTGMGSKSNDKKFIYAENSWDIAALTSAISGLTKKVKAEEDNKYLKETTTHINGNYSYELRFMNSYTSASKNIILYDSLENYDPTSRKDNGTESDWHGTPQSIDVSQLREKGIDPVVYISTKEKLNPEDYKDISNTSIWTRVTDLSNISNAKAIAIDARKKTDNTDFVLNKGESLVAYLYMKAPAQAPDSKTGKDYPYAYNNIYVSDTVFNPSNQADKGQDFFIHYDYTQISLIITGNANIKKISSKTKQPVNGITFRMFGTSDYGHGYDVQRTSDSNGSISFENVEKGSYILQEYKTNDDYLMDSTQHTVQINNTGRTIIDGTDYTDTPIQIENKPRVHTDVSFYKVDSMFTVTKLAGAKYRLSGKSDYGTDVLMTAESSYNEDDLGKVTFNNIEKGTYSLKELEAPKDHTIDPTEYTVIIDEDANVSIFKKAVEDIYDTKTAEVTKYSHTQNITDDGTQNSNYGNNWSNSNIRGTDRDSSNSQAHVITIPGAKTLHVRITWGGESSSYDWVSVWEGSHPEYTAYNNRSTAISDANRLGGGSHTSSSNTKEFDVNGDSVTFSYRSDSSGNGDGYGYYAVITGEQTVQGDLLYHKGDLIEIDKDKNDYILKDEPLHYFTFQKLSSYDKSTIANAEFKITGVSDNGTSVNTTAKSDSTGTVRFDNLEAGNYVLQETKAPEGFELNTGKYIVMINSDGKYSITGLTQENGIYTMYDTKTADKKVTVTKVWDDGKTNHVPTELTMTISTDVPDASKRTFTVIYDANEGSFGN